MGGFDALPLAERGLHLRNALARVGDAVKFYSDSLRHLVCYPYSVANLHAMAKELGINRCWFHSSRLAHYDIPARRIREIAEKTTVVSGRVILAIIQGYAPPFVP